MCINGVEWSGPEQSPNHLANTHFGQPDHSSDGRRQLGYDGEAANRKRFVMNVRKYKTKAEASECTDGWKMMI